MDFKPSYLAVHVRPLAWPGGSALTEEHDLRIVREECALTETIGNEGLIISNG